MSTTRSIGTWGMLFAAVSGITGSGWLFGPYFAAQMAGPAAILSWLIGGVAMIFVALTFAELSTTFPVRGSGVRFLQFSHGTVVSFSMAWVGWLASLAVAPVETMALLHYAASQFPWIMYPVHGVELLSSQGMLLASGLMLVMCGLNAFGIHVLQKANNFAVILKLVIPVLTAIMLLVVGFHIHNFTAAGFAPGGAKQVLAALPMAGIIFSFIGYAPAIQLAGEAKNPQRSLPIAIIGALLIGIVMYVLLQTAFIGALHPQDYAQGWSHLHFTGSMGPIYGVVMGLGIVWLASVIFVGAIISPFGTGLIFTGSTARMNQGMADNGYFPKRMMQLNRYGSPGRILVLNYVIGLFLFLPFPTWQKMMSFLVSCLVFAYAVGPLALMVLREKMPDQPRPFKIPYAGTICLIAFYICNLILCWAGWFVISKMMIAIVLGYVVLFIYQRFHHTKADLQLHWRRSSWMFCYVIAIGCVAYLGTFSGGRGVISFEWDFVVIALVTVAIFYWSRYEGLKIPTHS